MTAAHLSSAVVFDFGAVLFRWQPAELLQQVLPELAPDEAAARSLATRLFQGFVPDSDWALFDLGQVDEAALAERIARRLGLPAEAVRRLIAAVPAHLTPLPTEALLPRLRSAGHRLYYLSNMPASYADHLEREHAFVRGFADGIFSSRVGLIKPQPAIFELAVRRFGLLPTRTLFIDDNAANIEAARALGWQALHFTDAAACEAALVAEGWL